MNLFYFAGWLLSACAAFFLFVLPCALGKDSNPSGCGSDLEISKALLDILAAIDGSGAILIGNSMNVILSSGAGNAYFDLVDGKTGGLSSEFKRQYLTALHLIKESGSASWRSPRKGGAMVFSAHLLCGRMTLVRCFNEVVEP